MNFLLALSVGFIRCFYKHLANQVVQDSRCEFRQIRILPALTDKPFHIIGVLFLWLPDNSFLVIAIASSAFFLLISNLLQIVFRQANCLAKIPKRGGLNNNNCLLSQVILQNFNL